MRRGIDRDERQSAFASLLAAPSVSRDGDPRLWQQVRKHRLILTEWFWERLGYQLVVTESAVRVYRLPVNGEVVAPRRVRPPSRRVLVLALLAAACAEDTEELTTVQELSDRVRTLSSQDQVRVAPYDSDRFTERQLFIRSVLILAELGALRPTKRTGEEMLTGWTRRQDAIGGAYRVDRETLLRLVDARALAAAVGRRAYHDHQQIHHRRFTVMRRLIELPVCLLEDLTEDERTYLASQRHRLLEWCREMTGWAVEQRREGLALIPPEDSGTDRPFPQLRADHFGALLVLDSLLSEELDSADLGTIVAAAETVRTRYPKAMTTAFREEPAQLADAAILLLQELDLIRRVEEGGEAGRWRVMPPAARFRGPEVVAAQQRLDPDGGGDSE
ncbi:TIGR02678 family protein [Nonomuraea typhae]|uniref:TIGR02678 family protein n=1 Tax=Nonomuraea typhae TaxID=2603600 RepID=UPI001CA552CD|nr:TIGR02678 family protein [Nonomuraea typhae]